MCENNESGHAARLKKFSAYLKCFPVVAILRGITPAEIVPVVTTLASGGIRLLEITLNSPEPYRSIGLARKTVESESLPVLIGAGTVLTPDEVSAVSSAGGEYVISPNTNPAVIRASVAAGLVSVPGFATPSEGFVALDAGADYLKCYPAGTFGPSYLKDLSAVLKAPFLATGGVTPENAADFLKVSAGLGIGSALYFPGINLVQLEENLKTISGLTQKAGQKEFRY